MGCACNKNRLKAASPSVQYVYDFTAPLATEVTATYGTPLEAKQAVRRNGGGVIRRRQINTGPAA